MFPTQTPLQQYLDLDGSPLDAGFIYYGVQGSNPITSPVTVYWDAAGTQPAAQPLRTSNGYIVRNGNPANVFANSSYSILIRDKNQSLIYFGADSTAFDIGANLASANGVLQVGSATKYVSAINSVDATGFPDGLAIIATGRDAAGDGGGGLFRYSSSSVQTVDGGMVYAPTVGAGRFIRDGWTVLGFNGRIYAKWFGVKGDGTTGDRTLAQSMITAIQNIGGGEGFFQNGSYEVNLSVTQAGVRLIGESIEGCTLQCTSGTAGNYAVTVDLSGGGVLKPLSFGLQNMTIIGDSNASRQYNGIQLYNVYQPDIRNVRFKALNKCIVGKGCFFGGFANIWFEHYTTGISGFNGSFGFNTCTFAGMNFFEGNVDGTAVPQDGTYMNNNTWISPSYSAANALNTNATIITGIQDTYINPRLESIHTTGHWMQITSGVKIINPLVTSQVSLASGKFVFDVTGYNNVIDCDLKTFNKVVRLESTSHHNKINVKTAFPVGGPQHILNLGMNNTINWGDIDYESGDVSNACAQTWSDVLIKNLITRSIDQNNVITDGLIAQGLQTSEIGPDSRGGCYRYDTPTGNRQITFNFGAVSINEYYVGSFQIKAISGGEQTIYAAVSENPLADYSSLPITISSDTWIRVPIVRKFTAAHTFAYLGIQLPVGHPGILLKGPQVVFNGTDATSGEIARLLIGGYVPTGAAERQAIPNKDAHKYQFGGAPTSGLWGRGDTYDDISLSAGAGSPGGYCISGDWTTAGTWKALANIAA